MTEPLKKSELIEQKIDRAAAGAVGVSSDAGGVQFTSMGEIMEFAKLMSISGQAVPTHLRENPGMCLAVAIQSAEWRMSPFAVANKSYVVNDRIGWESQLVHAVIEQRAPLMGRIRHRFNGDGGGRTCTVWAQVKGEVEPLEYTSPPFGTILPKNSPLWKTKPDLQLYYNTVRDFARVYFPDILMGVYAKDEIEDSAPMRLVGESGKSGFRPVQNPLNDTAGEEEATKPAETAADAPAAEQAPTSAQEAKPEPVAVSGGMSNDDYIEMSLRFIENMDSKEGLKFWWKKGSENRTARELTTEQFKTLSDAYESKINEMGGKK